MNEFRGILHGVTELPGYERFPTDGAMADEIIDGLTELAEVLEAGESVGDHFRVTIWEVQ